MSNRIRVLVEAATKKVFVCALDWPGWSRGAKTEELAVEALLAAAPRYAAVAREARLTFDGDKLKLEVAERLPGGGGTAIVEAAWTIFDRVAEAAPEELRKGPRGGGRDRTKIVGHVNEADGAYAREVGLKDRPRDVAALRAAMLEVLRTPSDGGPLAGRRWTQRYAARRIAWHALDHAWEIEDRTEPA
jgi:hypothetical protein